MRSVVIIIDMKNLASAETKVKNSLSSQHSVPYTHISMYIQNILTIRECSTVSTISYWVTRQMQRAGGYDVHGRLSYIPTAPARRVEWAERMYTETLEQRSETEMYQSGVTTNSCEERKHIQTGPVRGLPAIFSNRHCNLQRAAKNRARTAAGTTHAAPSVGWLANLQRESSRSFLVSVTWCGKMQLLVLRLE